MPIYEYECTKCGHQTEALQKFSDSPLTECEICHGRLKKLISHNTFHLKGTGWYVTDYASKTGGNKGHSPKTEAKTPDSSSTGSGDTSKKADTSTEASGKSSKEKTAHESMG
jgi:putative FmdB family regulatory protein